MNAIALWSEAHACIRTYIPRTDRVARGAP